MYQDLLWRAYHSAKFIEDSERRGEVQRRLERLADRAVNRESGVALIDAKEFRELELGLAGANRVLLNPDPNDTPWWLTWWFVLSVISATTAICLGIGTYNQRRAKRNGLNLSDGHLHGLNERPAASELFGDEWIGRWMMLDGAGYMPVGPFSNALLGDL
jgi:hypothetical protein